MAQNFGQQNNLPAATNTPNVQSAPNQKKPLNDREWFQFLMMIASQLGSDPKKAVIVVPAILMSFILLRSITNEENSIQYQRRLPSSQSQNDVSENISAEIIQFPTPLNSNVRDQYLEGIREYWEGQGIFGDLCLEDTLQLVMNWDHLSQRLLPKFSDQFLIRGFVERIFGIYSASLVDQGSEATAIYNLIEYMFMLGKIHSPNGFENLSPYEKGFIAALLKYVESLNVVIDLDHELIAKIELFQSPLYANENVQAFNFFTYVNAHNGSTNFSCLPGLEEIINEG